MSTTGDRLESSGVAFAGAVATNLIENIQKHLDVKRVVYSGNRQTHLEWNSDCAAVETYFETVSQTENLS